MVSRESRLGSHFDDPSGARIEYKNKPERLQCRAIAFHQMSWQPCGTSTTKGAMAPSVGLVQIDLILDANIIVGELCWVTKHRMKSDACSALVGVIEAGTLRA